MRSVKLVPEDKNELERALKELAAKHGEMSTELVSNLEALATLCLSTGDYSGAQKYYERSIEILRGNQTFTTDLLRLIKMHHSLGLVHRIQECFDLAEPHYQKALQLSRKHWGDRHPETIVRQNYLAGLYCAWGRYAGSEFLLRDSLQFYEQTLGAEHEVTAITLYALALVTRRSSYAVSLANNKKAGDVPVAPVIGGVCKDYYERAVRVLNIEIAKLSIDQRHDLFLALMRLSYDRFAEGRFDEAEELFRHSLLMELQEIWPHHPLVSDAYQILGDFHKSFGVAAHSEDLYRKALSIREEVFGGEHAKVAATAQALGVLLCDMQRYDEAEPLLKRACDIYHHNSFAPLFANSLRAYSHALKALNRSEEAQGLLSQADHILDQHGNSPTT